MAKHKGLTHSEVAHRWANAPNGDDYGDGHHMFFNNGVICSYGHHFVIARHVKNDKGEGAVLFTTHDYSVSTQSHKSITRGACHHLKVFETPGAEFNHVMTMARYQSLYDEYVEKAARVSVMAWRGPEWKLEQAEEVRAKGNEYAEFFGINDCIVPAFKLHLDWIHNRWNRLNSPEAKAKREVEREKRDARLAAKLEKFREKYSERLAEWKAGKAILVPHDPNSKGAFLRLKGKVIQTSMGAEFPIDHGKLAYRLIKRVRAHGEAWQPNGEKSPTLGYYTIDRISGDGTVRAGCHIVTWSEILDIAKQLGIA
jgi:hypothetical protein